MENMRFKAGDRVRIKDIDWYNENKNKRGFICFDRANFIPEMSRYCGEILTINRVVEEFEQYLVSECVFSWTDEMIEGLVEESDDFDRMYMESEKRYKEEYSKNEYCHEQSFKWGFQEGYDCAHEKEKLEINLKNGYEFKDENGNVINATKIVLEKKKKEYPKTFEECCKILGFLNVDLCFNADYRSFDASKEQWKRLGLMNQFYQLLICRDAYWKIAGEEMGLGKSWKPISAKGYCTYAIIHHTGHIRKSRPCADSALLEFPTEEMRDAFYDNFKVLIEQCKELL